MATYIVKKGDNLSTIAKKFGMTEQELMKENNINPNRKYIYSGDAINVIDNRSAEAKAKAPLPEVNNKIEEYIVQKGDNYHTISQKYKISLADLMELNNKDPFFDDLILPGDSLKVIDRNHAEKVMAGCSTGAKSSKGGCPLNNKIAIFPVRYAIDEAPDKKGGKSYKPLPKDWVGPVYSPIKTRNYTLRQLRDGWLYVWNGKSFEEYQIKGSNFNHTARKDKTVDTKFEQDGIGTITSGEKGSKAYLELPTQGTIFLTYSEERWTENYYQRMADNKNNERAQFMREFNVPAYLKGEKTAHTEDLKKIADYVADIDKNVISEAQRFTSTMVQPSPTVSGVDEKNIITDNSVISKLSDDYISMFLALDDHLGILHDLTLQLTGRNDELMQFDNVHQHRLYVSSVLEQLCGSQLKSSDYPSQVGTDDSAKRAFTKELETCLDEIDPAIDTFRKTRGSAIIQYSEESIKNAGLKNAWDNKDYLGFDNRPPNATSIFRKKYPSFTFEQYKSSYATWGKAKKARKAVNYDEAIAYLDNEKIRDPLTNHIEQASTDITNYLTKLGADPLVIFLDNTFKPQSAILTTIFTSIHQQLSMYSEKAQEWLETDLSTNNTLISLIPYNFSKPLALALEAMAKYYDENQKLEPDEPDFNSEVLLANMLGVANIANNADAAKSAAEAEKAEQERLKKTLKTAITYQRIKDTNTFKGLPETAQQAYLIYPDALKSSTDAWEGWQRSVLYRTRTFTRTTTHVYEAISITMIHLVIYGQVTEEVNIQVSNPDFEKDMKDWMQKKEKLKSLIAAKETQVALPRTDKKAYQQQIKNARRKMSYRRGMNPVVRSRLQAKADLPRLRQELAELEQAIPTKEKITGFFKKTSTRKIMDIHLIKMIFRRITIVETTTFTQSQAAGYVYSKVGGTTAGVPSSVPPGSPSNVPATTGIPKPPLMPSSSHSASPAATLANDEALAGFLERNGVSVIGVILVGLNAINVMNTIAKPIINGQADKSDIQSMIMSTAALTSLLFSFKTNKLWSVVSKEVIRVQNSTGRWVSKKLIEVSRETYKVRWRQALGGTFGEQANKFLKLGAIMSVFGVIANAVETWQILGTKVGEATNTSEKIALYVKSMSTIGMGSVFAYQLIATTIRRTSLGRAFGVWGTAAMLVASIIYLAADYFASIFRYEGFELWCSRCIWAKKKPYWPDTEQGNQEEIRALQEILMAPQLVIIPHKTSLNTKTVAYYIFDMYLMLPPLPENTMGQLKVDIGIENIFGSGSTTGGKNNYIYKPQELIDFVEDLEDNQQWVLREDFEKQCEKTEQNSGNLSAITDDDTDFADVSGAVDVSQLVWFSRGMVESKGWSRINYEFEFTYPPEVLAPRLDKRGYIFTVDALGPKMLSRIYTAKPADNPMENSQDASTYTVKESDVKAVNTSPYQVTIFPPRFED